MVKLQGQMGQLAAAVETLREEWEEAAAANRGERETIRCVYVGMTAEWRRWLCACHMRLRPHLCRAVLRYAMMRRDVRCCVTTTTNPSLSALTLAALPTHCLTSHNSTSRRDWEAERARIAAAEAEVARLLSEQQAEFAEREEQLIGIR